MSLSHFLAEVINMYYKWDRVFDSELRTLELSGIIAAGQSGLIRPIEDKMTPMNVLITAGMPYFDGYLLLGPGLIIYIDVNGLSSENKIDMDISDGGFYNGFAVICSKDGKILIGTEKLTFQDYSHNMRSINKVNLCGDKFALSGNCQVSIIWQENDKIKYTQVGSAYNFKNAFVYDKKVFAYSDDGYLNIYFTDDDMNIDSQSLYRVNVDKALKNADPGLVIYNMYVDHGKTNDIYFLCNKGVVAVIPDFKYDRTSVDTIENNLIIYASKLTNDSHFMDMIHYKDTFVLVGYGEERESCITTKMLGTRIVEHNFLSSSSGADRYMYNFGTTYETKYLESHENISNITALAHLKLNVHQDDNGYYISKDDIDINHRYDIVDVEDAISVPFEWINDKIYVNVMSDARVTLLVYVNEEVQS